MDSPKGKCAAMFFVFLILTIVSISGDYPEVTLGNGLQLRGTVRYSRDGHKYYTFLGVPYASVITRFEDAQPVTWSGVRDATQPGPVCPQYVRVNASVIGEEDCLHLNIFSKNLTGNAPVIVYIHGGGSAHLYGGAYFMDEDVILVPVNYRLGALGFLCTGDGNIQCNNGLRDQNLALQWVKANIQVFGGDQTKITLMGQSLGAAFVQYHLLSPMSKGLFNGAIIQSGSALSPVYFEPDPLTKAVDLAEILDCPSTPINEMVTCLRSLDFQKLVRVQMKKWHLDPLVLYSPCAEFMDDETKAFLPGDPLTLFQAGTFNRVPVVTGIMEEEGLLFHSAYILQSKELQRSINLDWNYVSPVTFYYDNRNIPSEKRDQISRTLRGYYFGSRKVEASTSRNLTNLYSDRLFVWGTRTAALLMAKFIPVYTYVFGFFGEYSMIQTFYSETFQGPIAPTHGDDLQYLFNSTRYPRLRPESREEQISKKIVKLWVSFASSGNMMGSLDTLKIPWLPVGLEEIRRKRLKWCYLDIESKIINRDPFAERMEFWDRLANDLTKTYPGPNDNDYVKEKNKDEF